MSWEDQPDQEDNIPKRQPPMHVPSNYEHVREKPPNWKRSSTIQRHMLFLTKVRPPFIQLKSPETFNLMGVRNFYLTTKNNVKIGVWHLLPGCLVQPTAQHDTQLDFDLADGHSIIVYAHGNSGTRGTYHRCQLYRRLQELNYHIVTFDYRSYGDSTAMAPDEVGVVEDTLTVIKWVLSRKKASPLYVWGHSLGTGVSSRAITELELGGVKVDGLILEAPFNNLTDEIKSHPLTLPFRYMIGFNQFFVNPLVKNGISFTTDQYLAQSRIPLLILHAEDDWVVPFKLGVKLYNHLLAFRKDAKTNVRFVKFGDARAHYGHKYICDCLMLPFIVKNFMAQNFDEIPAYVD